MFGYPRESNGGPLYGPPRSSNAGISEMRVVDPATALHAGPVVFYVTAKGSTAKFGVGEVGTGSSAPAPQVVVHSVPVTVQGIPATLLLDLPRQARLTWAKPGPEITIVIHRPSGSAAAVRAELLHLASSFITYSSR